MTWDKFKININTEQDDDDAIFETEKSNIVYRGCPSCKTEKLRVDLDSQHWFCDHCGWAGSIKSGVKENHSLTVNPYNPYISGFNPIFTIDEKTLNSFKNQKGISQETLQHFNITQKNVYFPCYQKSVSSIVFPYYEGDKLVNISYSHSNQRHSEFGGKQICYGFNDINDDETYIVLNEFEKLAFYEVGITNVISLFAHQNDVKNITKSLDFLVNIESRLEKVKKFIICVPFSDYGKAINDELVRRLGKAKCWTCFTPQEGYDWCKTLSEFNHEQFKSFLKKAKATPVKGIFELNDVEEAFDHLYLYGLRKGEKTGFPLLDPYYTVIPGQWTLVTGIPGHGKSNILDAILVNLATYSDWSFGFFSPENQPIQRHFASIMEKKLLKPFGIGNGPRISEEEKNATKAFINKHFSIILPDEDENWSIDGILDLAKVLVYRKGIKGLVIDPWNEIDHSRKGNKSETEYISEVLTKIRQFARNYDVHVWIVAHPTKMSKDSFGRFLVPTPYDVAGSAHFRNKADNAISVWRNADGDDRDIVDIYIQKIRFKEVGKIGLVSMRYEQQNGQYHDDIDQIKRAKCIKDGEHPPTVEQLLPKINKIIPKNTGILQKTNFSKFDDLNLDDDSELQF